jgi:hypothetical protein
MSDPADRHLDEQRLEGRLHTLARGVQPPVVPAAADVRRGRRRLVQMRLAVAGATTGTLAVVLGLTSLTAGDPTATEPPPVSQPPTTTIPSTDGSPSSDTGSGSEHLGGQTDPGAGGPALDAGGGTKGSAGRLPANPGPSGAASGGTATQGGPTSHASHHEPSHGPSHELSPEPVAATSDPTQPPSESPTTTPTTTATSTTSPTPTPTPTATATATPTVPPTEPGKVRVHRALRHYNDVLAEHLDPSRDHLQPYDRLVDTKETTRRGGILYALGSTYRWEGRASRALGIRVASGWDQVEWACGASYAEWACRSAEVAAPAVSAEVANHDGVREVAVEHADGRVVVLTTDAPVRVADELVAAAADDRLFLPGDAPMPPPLIDSLAFADAGRDALVRTGESFDQTAIDRTPEVRGTWTAGDAAGQLTWSVRPVYSGAGWTCLKAYRECTEVDGLLLDDTIHVARLKKRLGGGWVVQYDGPSYVVRVTASDRAFPKKRAFAFVTDPDWQPVR